MYCINMYVPTILNLIVCIHCFNCSCPQFKPHVQSILTVHTQLSTLLIALIFYYALCRRNVNQNVTRHIKADEQYIGLICI